MADRNIYLIAKYVGQPKDPHQTVTKGYMTNPENIQYDEQVYIARGLRNRDLQNQVILNLTEEKIVKNTFKSGNTFHELFQQFYEGYAEYIDQSVNTLNEHIS